MRTPALSMRGEDHVRVHLSKKVGTLVAGDQKRHITENVCVSCCRGKVVQRFAATWKGAVWMNDV